MADVQRGDIECGRHAAARSAGVFLHQFHLLIADVGFVIPAKAGIQFLLFDIMFNSFGNF